MNNVVKQWIVTVTHFDTGDNFALLVLVENGRYFLQEDLRDFSEISKEKAERLINLEI